MSDWKVTVESIEVLPHYNADSLVVVKAGDRQYVSQSSVGYKTGDFVVQIPEKSLLPPTLAEHFTGYLTGSGNNRVKSVKLRGETSEGVLLSLDKASEFLIDGNSFANSTEFWTNSYSGVDRSELFGIVEYTPPIPASLAGNVKVNKFGSYGHDCEHYGINHQKYSPEDVVWVSEKLHGSQAIVFLKLSAENEILETAITSKGLNKRGLVLEQSESNLYWQAWNNVKNSIDFSGFEFGCEVEVQLVGEALPCQKGYTYGFSQPTIRFFLMVVNKIVRPLFQLSDVVGEDLLAPTIYLGSYEGVEQQLRTLADVKRSSIDNKTIQEGVVVSLANSEKYLPHLKIISKHYKQTDEEFS